MSAPAVARRSLALPDRRTRIVAFLVLAVLLLIGVVVAGTVAQDAARTTHLDAVSQGPSAAHWFGTDRLGRDMLARTLVGLRLSLVVGTTAALASAVIAVVLATVSVTVGRWAETAVNWLVDFFLALPHLVLLILLAFALGGGTQAVIIAVAITHWPTLTRVLQAQARQVVASEYVASSRALGTSGFALARGHLLPHLLPHFVVGTALMFPHAILHEAALSFLGLGIDPSQPAIGILLSDSMKVLSAGMWWLAVLPGVCLLVMVKLVDSIGENLRSVIDPRSYHL
ncbi:ABC transporter permease [Asanoa siamensis]|uniref:Peptide ABC transporter permease n=1 Tax=Asanoa siamensis TaxID=926357 RepID=A0ABQ4D109_9ACTN|nr:ABC transporter permease [Asanoa siamensis]GIF77224.1 peptide ABC transporter permease [Asanoa siamensis]